MGKSFVHVVLFAAVSLAATSVRANLISNGSFEDPPTATFALIPKNSTALTDWVVTDDNVDVVKANANNFVIGNAQDGTQYLDLNGDRPGAIEQTFATVPGNVYTFSFYYSNNYVNTASARAVVGIRSGNFDPVGFQFFTHAGAAANALDWTLFTQDFIAVAPSATVSFIADPANTSSGGILLDNVSVERAVPEPAGLSLLLIPLTLVRCRFRSVIGDRVTSIRSA